MPSKEFDPSADPTVLNVARVMSHVVQASCPGVAAAAEAHSQGPRWGSAYGSLKPCSSLQLTPAPANRPALPVQPSLPCRRRACRLAACWAWGWWPPSC